MSAADPRSQMLSELSRCAYRLGLAFGAEAERADTTERQLEYFQLFDRCFFAVRMATALELRLRRAPTIAPPSTETEREALEPERLEQERADREPAETDRDRERDREAEPASMPVLLCALDGVAADASALPGPAPAALPALRELLAGITSETAAAAPPGEGRALRARLAGSATSSLLTLPPRSPRSGLRNALSVRRATGPPR